MAFTWFVFEVQVAFGALTEIIEVAIIRTSINGKQIITSSSSSGGGGVNGALTMIMVLLSSCCSVGKSNSGGWLKTGTIVRKRDDDRKNRVSDEGIIGGECDSGHRK